MSAHRAPRARQATRAASREETTSRHSGGRRRAVSSTRRPASALTALSGVAVLATTALAATYSSDVADAGGASGTRVGPTGAGVSVAAGYVPQDRADSQGGPGDAGSVDADAFTATRAPATLTTDDGDPRVSRSFDRAPAAPASRLNRLTQRAELAAAARERRLRQTTVSAEDMSQEIKKERARQRRLARIRARAEANEWEEPTSGYDISTWFGEAGPYWESGYHTGIDFATGCGTPVVAVTDGTISEAGNGIGGWAYGNQIRLRFDDGDEVWYNHLSSIGVASGESVSKGEVLGTVGDTGNSYGCHLHFEYRESSDLDTGVNPLPYLEDNGISLR